MKCLSSWIIVLFSVLFFISSSSAETLDIIKPLKTIELVTEDGLQSANLYAIPHKAKSVDSRDVDGRLLVISVPSKKLYWWRYEMGGYPENSTFPVDQFLKRCKPYVEKNELMIFCTTSKWLLVGRSNKVYKSEAALSTLVYTEYENTVPNFKTGLDYFDKRIDLSEILEPSFFSEPGNVKVVPIRIGDIGKKKAFTK